MSTTSSSSASSSSASSSHKARSSSSSAPAPAAASAPAVQMKASLWMKAAAVALVAIVSSLALERIYNISGGHDAVCERVVGSDWRNKVAGMHENAAVVKARKAITPVLSDEEFSAAARVFITHSLVAVGATTDDAIFLATSSWFGKEATLGTIGPEESIAVLIAKGEAEGKPSINTHTDGVPEITGSSSATAVAALEVGVSHLGAKLLVMEDSLVYGWSDADSRFSEFSHIDKSRYVTAAERDFVRMVIFPIYLDLIEKRNSKVVVIRHMLGDNDKFNFDIPFGEQTAVHESAAGALDRNLDGYSEGAVRVEGTGHFSSAGISGGNAKAAGPLLFVEAVAEALFGVRTKNRKVTVEEKISSATATIREALSNVPDTTSMPFVTQALGLFSHDATSLLVGGSSIEVIGEAVKKSVSDIMDEQNEYELGAEGVGQANAIEAAAWDDEHPIVGTSPKLPDIVDNEIQNQVRLCSSAEELLGDIAELLGPGNVDVDGIKRGDVSAISGFGKPNLFASSSKALNPAMAAKSQLRRYLAKQRAMKAGDQEERKSKGVIYVTVMLTRQDEDENWIPEAIYSGSSVQLKMSAFEALKKRWAKRMDSAKKHNGGDALTSLISKTIQSFEADEIDPSNILFRTYVLPLAEPAESVPGGAAPVVHFAEAMLIQLLRQYEISINVMEWTFSGVLSHEAAVDMGSLSVVRNGVTVYADSDMKNELGKLRSDFPGTAFTVDNRVIKVETNAFGGASAKQLADALQRIGKSVHGYQTVVTNGVTLNDGLNMKTELRKLHKDFPDTTFTIEKRVIMVETDKFGGATTGQLAGALLKIGKSVQHAHAGEYLHDQRRSIKPIHERRLGLSRCAGPGRGCGAPAPSPAASALFLAAAFSLTRHLLSLPCLLHAPIRNALPGSALQAPKAVSHATRLLANACLCLAHSLQARAGGALGLSRGVRGPGPAVFPVLTLPTASRPLLPHFLSPSPIQAARARAVPRASSRTASTSSSSATRATASLRPSSS